MNILHIKNPNMPQFRFEWHTGKKIVYAVRVGTKPEIGEALAFDIENHGAAVNAVLIWCRGYREGAADATAPHIAA